MFIGVIKHIVTCAQGHGLCIRISVLLNCNIYKITNENMNY